MLSTSLSSQNDAFSPFSWSPPDDYCMTMLYSSTLLSSSFYLIPMTANHIHTPHTCLFSRTKTLEVMHYHPPYGSSSSASKLAFVINSLSSLSLASLAI